MKGVLLHLVALLGLLVGGQAIFEEQAGQVDWLQQNLGRVTHAEFAFRGRERVFLGTAAGVVASLDTRDGSIAWRQVLEEGDSVDALALVPRPASVLSLSQQGKRLRSWNALDGALLWERPLPGSHPQQASALALLPGASGEGGSQVAVTSGNQLQVLSAATGKLVWSVTLPGPALAAQLAEGAAEPTLLVLSRENGGTQLRALEAKSGTELSAAELPGAEQFSLGRKAAAVLSSGKLCAVAPGASRAACTSLSAVLGAHPTAVRLGSFLRGTQLAIHTDSETAIVDVSGGGFALTSRHPGMGSAVAGEGGVAGLAGADTQGRLATVLADLAAGKAAEPVSHAASLVAADGSRLEATVLALASRKTGEHGQPEAVSHRWLVTAADDSLYLLEGGKVAWQREEGLASVSGTLFVDLPARAEAAEHDGLTKPTLVDRINAEVLSVKMTLGIIQPEEKPVLKRLNARLSTALLPHRDANGFRKAILALSASGKLFALHSGDGRILWRLPLGSGADYSRIFTWRTSRDPHTAPEVVLLGAARGRAAYLVVNAHTGAVVTGGSLAAAAEQVIQLPPVKDGRAEQHVFALLAADLSAAVLPETPAARQALARQPLHFWRHDKAAGLLSGYRLAAGAAAAEQQWSLSFPEPNDSILAIAAKDAAEHTYSYAKVLGDRSLKLKYLNPNALLVVSGPPTPAAALSAADSSLSVQLIDAVSGLILFRSSLEGASGPVRAVVSENWAVYSYYSTASHLHEIAVLEAFETREAPKIPGLLFGSQNASLNAYAPPALEVLHQSYFLAGGLKTLGVTATRKGITSKQLLLGTASDQVYLLDKRFVDPRRPKGPPMDAQKAEMLPPYQEEIGFVPQFFATHRETVERLSSIVTSPANLESTTLLLSRGLDLFFTRVQPSKSFDLLPDDFPYALLVLVTGALIAGAFILRRMDVSATTKRKWL